MKRRWSRGDSACPLPRKAAVTLMKPSCAYAVRTIVVRASLQQRSNRLYADTQTFVHTYITHAHTRSLRHHRVYGAAADVPRAPPVFEPPLPPNYHLPTPPTATTTLLLRYNMYYAILRLYAGTIKTRDDTTARVVYYTACVQTRQTQDPRASLLPTTGAPRVYDRNGCRNATFVGCGIFGLVIARALLRTGFARLSDT